MANQSPIDYSIESLPEIFKSHADINDEMLAEQIKTYHDINSDPELPDHLKNAFNISRALAVMCEEIRNLKETVKK